MTSAAPGMDTNAPADPHSDDSILTAHRKTQIMVSAACVVCVAMFWTVGKWMGIPGVRGMQGSLLQLPLWPMDLIAVYVLVVLSALIGTVIAGRFWFYAGLFCGCIGLASLSVRGGAMHNVLFNAYSIEGAGSSPFHRLLLEHVLLFIPVALLWIAFSRGWGQALIQSKLEADPDGGPAIASVALQIVVMGALVYFLTPNDSKKQIVFAVFLSAMAATSAASHFSPSRKAEGWYWAGPCLVGIVAYIAASLNATDFTLGVPTGALGNLARPLPLDYAGSGVAGALLGCWMGTERPHVTVWLLNSNVLAHALGRAAEAAPTVEPEKT